MITINSYVCGCVKNMLLSRFLVVVTEAINHMYVTLLTEHNLMQNCTSWNRITDKEILKYEYNSYENFSVRFILQIWFILQRHSL